MDDNQVKLEEAQQTLQNKKLNESFERLRSSVNVRKEISLTQDQLEQRITVFLDKNKNNPILKEYLELEAMKKDMEKSAKNNSDILYEDCTQLTDLGVNKDTIEKFMNDTVLNNSIIKVTYKAAYTKRTINSEKFYDMFPKTTDVYKELVTESPVKGNMTIKELDDK